MKTRTKLPAYRTKK